MATTQLPREFIEGIKEKVNREFAKRNPNMNFNNLMAIFAYNNTNGKFSYSEVEQHLVHICHLLFRVKAEYGEDIFKKQVYRDLGLKYVSAPDVKKLPKKQVKPKVETLNKANHKSKYLVKKCKHLHVDESHTIDGCTFTSKEWAELESINLNVLRVIYYFAPTFKDALEYVKTQKAKMDDKRKNLAWTEKIYPDFAMSWCGVTYNDEETLAKRLNIPTNYLKWGYRYFNGNVNNLKECLRSHYGLVE